MLRINEVFETFQGEAYWTGTPALFVRMQSCDVGCPWCDTKYTWSLYPTCEISLPTILQKEEESPAYAVVQSAFLADALLRHSTSRHIVLTGGEPCIYDLYEVSQRLLAAGRSVQIETSGTYPILADDRCWITVSPKIGMPGGHVVRPDALVRANELKFPVGKRRDIEKLDLLLATVAAPPRLIWLQPLSQSPRATAVCIEVARARGWRISFQVHKYVGAR